MCALESSKGSEVEHGLVPFRIPIDHVFNATKTSLVSVPEQTAPTEPEGTSIQRVLCLPRWGGYLIVDVAPSDDTFMTWIMKDISESLSNLEQPWEITGRKQPETLDEHAGSALIQYKEVTPSSGPLR